jgi:hypothetical protein
MSNIWNGVTYQHSTNVPKALDNPYFEGDADEWDRYDAWQQGVEWAIEAIRNGDLVIDNIDRSSHNV